ncbi:collagen alpha-1(II) chain-like [Haemorhous mexicanus]|uniref:collagen alpha-1(II) chain-like n=1 Tax=Haemorhous mexicanus TaxID=30427 RepID=UPI0028BD5D2B|nr:collagen alpha-1(II) chain-like [Haemorhous mexicanus]
MTRSLTRAALSISARTGTRAKLSIGTGSPQLEHVLPQPPAPPPPAPPGGRWSYLDAPGREARDGGRRRRPWRSAADAWRRRRPECGSRRARSLPRRRRSPVGLGLGGGGSAASPAQGGVGGGGFRRGRLRSVPCTPRCLRCCCLFTFPEKGPARREGAEPSRRGAAGARGGSAGQGGERCCSAGGWRGGERTAGPGGRRGLAPIVALSGLRPWHSLARTRSRSQPSALLPPPPARGPPPTAHRSRRRDAPPQWRPEPPWPPGPPGKGRPLPRQRGPAAPRVPRLSRPRVARIPRPGERRGPSAEQ